MQTIKEIRAEKSRKIIEEGIVNELPKRAIAAQLNIQLATLDTYLKLLGLSYKEQQAKKGQQKGSNKYKPANYYIDNKIPVSGCFLLKRLI